MKKTVISLALIAALLTACAQSQIHFADTADVEKALDESAALAASFVTENTDDEPDLNAAAAKENRQDAEGEPAEKETEDTAESTPSATSETEPAPVQSAAPEATTPETASALTPVSEEPIPTSEPEPASTSEPAQTPAPAYGAVPFEVAAGTEKWWSIDSNDSAYWAMAEQINAVRAAGGLPALAMDGNLSAIASARCESFVAGGPFDHSGMVTTSEICAAGPIGSASAACAAWQASETHYANIMRTDISSMGVGCWFCSVDGNNYTYWTVTFQ